MIRDRHGTKSSQIVSNLSTHTCNVFGGTCRLGSTRPGIQASLLSYISSYVVPIWPFVSTWSELVNWRSVSLQDLKATCLPRASPSLPDFSSTGCNNPWHVSRKATLLGTGVDCKWEMLFTLRWVWYVSWWIFHYTEVICMGQSCTFCLLEDEQPAVYSISIPCWARIGHM